MKKLIKTSIFLLLALLPSLGFAASHYIHPLLCESACDGSSWAKAWTTFGAVTWTRGDTYYVAGGAYAENVNITSPLAGTTRITIKKANAADNSGDAGWNPSFADTQALISGSLSIASGYITLDGVTGVLNSGHGIKVKKSVSTGGNALTYFGAGQPSISVSHLEFEGTGMNDANGWSALKQVNGQTPSKNIYIGYCYLHEFSQNGLVFTGVAGTSYDDYGLLVENIYTHNTGGTLGTGHGQTIQCGAGKSVAPYEIHSYWIIRNSFFHNGVGTALLACLGYTQNDHMRFINNIARNDGQSYDKNTNQWTSYIPGKVPFSPGVIYTSSTGPLTSATYFEIYNNTFYNIYKNEVALQSPVKHDNYIKNNASHSGRYGYMGGDAAIQTYNSYYACQPIITYGIYGCPYNQVGQQNETSDPFVNAALNNFNLVPGAKSIGNGTDLRTIFSDDFNGSYRAAWDIGAIAASTAPDVTAPELAVVTPITSSVNNTPALTFSTNEPGNISYGGACGNGDRSYALYGNNITVFGPLAVGVYSNCTITVTDGSGNASLPLGIASFEVQDPIDTVPPTVDVFNLGATSSSLTVPLSMSCSDDTVLDLAPYCIVEVNSAAACVWRENAPTSHTFQTGGAHSLYGFCRDVRLNVSAASSGATTITPPDESVGEWGRGVNGRRVNDKLIYVD